jgi:hypothetical protein
MSMEGRAKLGRTEKACLVAFSRMRRVWMPRRLELRESLRV